jgi:hypothetical protein
MALTQAEMDELELLELEELEAAESGGFQDITPEQFEGESNWYDRPRALLQGAALGFSDELGALAGAGMAKAHQAITGIGDQSYGDIYNEMHQQFQDERERYERENPGEALALNLLGGIATGGASLQGIKAIKNAPKLVKALAIAGEGAVAGAGVSDQGERLGGAALGAPVSLATAGALKTPGMLVNALTKRRIKTPLRGRPIHMATHPDDPGVEGAIGNFYRRGVGGAFLGRNVLMGQEKPIIEAAEEAVNKVDIVDDLKKGVQREWQDRKIAFDDNIRSQQGDVNVSRSNQIEQAADAARMQEHQARALPQKVKTMEDAKIRDMGADLALPERVPEADRASLVGAHPDEVMGYLRNWWKNNGFNSVKKNTFNWDSGLKKSLKGMVKADPALKLQLGSVDKRVDALISKLGKKGLDEIDGRSLMAIRNFFAMASNDTSKIVSQRALREVANRFDDMITKQLGGDDLKAFQDDMVRWGPTRTYRDAVDKAANKKGGLFGADEYLSATKDGRKLEGKAPGQVQARAAQNRIRSADEMKKSAINQIVADKRKATGSIRRKNEKLSKALAKQKRDEAVRMRRAEQDDPRVLSAQDRLTDAKAALADIKKQTVPENTTWPSQLVSTIAMGAPATAIGGAIGGPIGAVSGAIPGMFTAKALAQMPVQKAVAGQLRGQRLLNIAQRRNRGSLTDEQMMALSRAIERYSAMQANN